MSITVLKCIPSRFLSNEKMTPLDAPPQIAALFCSVLFCSVLFCSVLFYEKMQEIFWKINTGLLIVFWYF